MLRLTATVRRGLLALGRQARLESSAEFTGSASVDAKRDWKAALAAVEWIKSITPAPCAICAKPLGTRSVLGPDNRLQHPTCAP